MMLEQEFFVAGEMYSMLLLKITLAALLVLFSSSVQAARIAHLQPGEYTRINKGPWFCGDFSVTSADLDEEVLFLGARLSVSTINRDIREKSDVSPDCEDISNRQRLDYADRTVIEQSETQICGNTRQYESIAHITFRLGTVEYTQKDREKQGKWNHFTCRWKRTSPARDQTTTQTR
jgi:hypothetical protein